MQSWIHVLEWRATARPEVTALVDDSGAVYSYAGLRAEYERRAGGWPALGVGPGDVVAIVAKNSADFLVQTFGVLRAGATPAFVNWRLSGRELAEVLALVEPAAVAPDAEFTSLVDRAMPASVGRVYSTPVYCPVGVIDGLEGDGIELFTAGPSRIDMLVAEIGRRENSDLSSLREIAYGTAPITPTSLTAALKAFGCRFRQIYG